MRILTILRPQYLLFLFVVAQAATPALAQMGGFGGPSVLGRSQQAGRRGGQAVRLRGFASAQGVYDSGLSSISQNGVQVAQGAAGTELFWGAYGGKNNRRSAYGLDYTGDFRHYTRASTWNGFSQFLSATYSNQPFRRVSFDVSGTVGTTNRAFGVGATGIGSGLNNLASFVSPNASLFDVRTNLGSASGSLTMIHSSRLSTSFSGSGYTVRRKSRLPGIDGVMGRVDTAYRLNRRQTIGVDLQYFKFDYTNAFGDVNVLDAGLLFSQQFGRSTQLSLRAGGMRIESFGTRQVSLEPEIAQLLGVAVTTEISYKRSYLPSGGLELTRRFQRGSLAFSYQTGPSPGNGIVLVARQHVFSANASYSMTRKMQITAGAFRTQLTSASSLPGRFNQTTLGGGLTYKVNRQIELISRVDRRFAETTAVNNFVLNGTRVSAGIIYSPDELPIQLW